MFFWLVIRSSPRDADLVEWRSLADPRAATAARPSGQIQVRNGGEGGLASPSLWDASLVGGENSLGVWSRVLRPRWSAQASRYQLARSQRSLSQLVGGACSLLDLATTRRR